MPRRRGNSRYYWIMIVVLVCLSATFFGFYQLLISVSWFNIGNITVKGNQYVPADSILALAKSCRGQNLIALDTSSLQDSLARIARIEEAIIQKRLMRSLVIKINERQGFLYVKSAEGNLFPIDQDGLILEKTGIVNVEDLPIVQSYLPDEKLLPGRSLSHLPIQKVLQTHKAILAAYPEFGQYISEYYIMDEVVHFVDARYGTQVIVSDENTRKQLERYIFVQDNGGIDRNSVIDLRFKDQVVVKAGK